MAVGVVTRVSPVEQQQIYTQIIQFAFELESWEISMGKTKFICDVDLQTRLTQTKRNRTNLTCTEHNQR